MRVSTNMIFRTALADINRQRHALARTQEQASSGLMINRPSDDPTGYGASKILESGLAAIEQFQTNTTRAMGRVTRAETAVAESMNLLIRARELAIQGANGSNDASARLQIAREIESLHESLVSEGNTRYSGAHLFAGFASDAPPFSAAGAFVDTPPSSPVVTFVGDTNEQRVSIDAGVDLQVGFNGQRIFMGDADGDGAPDPGREDIFDVLADLRNALVANDVTATQAALPRIDAAMDQLSQERTRIGVSLERLESNEQRLSTRAVDLETRLSNIRDADLAKVVSELVQQEGALQAGLSAMARLLQPTLLDFLS